MQKAAVCGKDLSAVIIEAENHPGPHLHPGVLDATDLLSDAAATTEVLKLLRFAQRVLIGAFDANEDDADIGCRHQLHQFVIVGEDASRAGENRARIEKLVAELGLTKQVRLLGRRDDVADVLASLDVLVSASRTEAFGMAMVEAMACGVPVVATATEGAREIIADGITGSLVPIGDVRALAAAVASLLEDGPRRLELGARGRESARARFGLGRMAEETERVYAEALGPGGEPHS